MTTPCVTCGNALPGREYLRVSVDKSGRERSPEEQHNDHERASRQHSFCLCAKPYKDVGSASPYARKGRDEFDKLIADLEHGRFGVPLLVLWDPSRGSRRLSEWVRLIELCQEHDVKIFVYTHGRILDLHHGRDRRALQEDGIDAEYASSKISEGTKRAAAANAVAGQWHGRIPFGYKRIRDSVTGKNIAQVPELSEAETVKELFARLLQGHSLRSIAKDFEARGITNHSGRPFTGQHLRALALTPSYAAIRVHDPGRKGHMMAPSDQAKTFDGEWTPLVSKADFHAVQRLLTAPERRTTRPGRGVHMLSMIATCGVCEGPLSVRTGKASRTGKNLASQYFCHHKSCVRVDQAELDAHAEAMMIVFLERPDVMEELNNRDNTTDTELAAVRTELAEVMAEVDELARRVGRGELSVAFAARTEPALQARIARLEQRRKELSTPSILFGLAGEDVRRSWKTADMSTKREIARLLQADDKLGPLRVNRAPVPGHHGPVNERVTWRPVVGYS